MLTYVKEFFVKTAEFALFEIQMDHMNLFVFVDMAHGESTVN